MNQWKDRMRFLWEEMPPQDEAPSTDRAGPAGVPRPLRAATRFAMIAVVATGLMNQVIGVRLVAPVDAAPSYHQQCIAACTNQLNQCRSNAAVAYSNCNDQAYKAYVSCKQTNCKGLTGPALDACNSTCTQTYVSDRQLCATTQKNSLNQCDSTSSSCQQGCNAP